MDTRKTIRIVIAVAGVAAIGAAAFWPRALDVDVGRVDKGPMRVTIDEDGETRVRDRFVVTAPVSGRLMRIELEPGDAVIAGKTVVARIAPADPTLLDARTRAELAAADDAARAAASQAKAERDRVAAVLDRARTSAKRQRLLADAGAISTDELEAATAAIATTESAWQAADFAAARAEQEWRMAAARRRTPRAGGDPVVIVAPSSGVVLKRHRESETVVSAGEPLLDVGDPSQMEVVADLLSNDAVRIRPGTCVSIERWGGTDPLAARVRRVEPSAFMKISALGVEEQRVNVVMELTDPSASRRLLGDGYRVEVRVVVWEQPDTVTVPAGSVFRRGDGWAVFVIDNGRARLQPVEIGAANNDVVQIVRGLDEGRSIVLHPPDVLEEGTRIAARKQPG